MHKILATLLLLGICQFQLMAQNESDNSEKIGKGDIGLSLSYSNPRLISISLPILVTNHISIAPTVNFFDSNTTVSNLNPSLITKIYFPYQNSARFYFNNETGIAYSSDSNGGGGINLLFVKLGLGFEYFYNNFSIGAGAGFTTKEANNFFDNCSNSVFNNCTGYLEVSGTIYID